jgi:hypothetical protein
MGVTAIFKSGIVGRKAPVFCRKGISPRRLWPLLQGFLMDEVFDFLKHVVF